jgi:hypothetical protein
MKKALFLIFTVIIGLSGSVKTSNALDQFTFTIPYNAQSLMPEVSGLQFDCLVFLNKPSSSSTWWTEYFGSGTKFVTVNPTTGNAAGTVQIVVNITKPSYQPIDMKYYVCYVSVKIGSSTRGMTYDSPVTASKAKQGTPLNTLQEGWLPGKGP